MGARKQGRRLTSHLWLHKREVVGCLPSSLTDPGFLPICFTCWLCASVSRSAMSTWFDVTESSSIGMASSSSCPPSFLIGLASPRCRPGSTDTGSKESAFLQQASSAPLPISETKKTPVDLKQLVKSLLLQEHWGGGGTGLASA